MAFKDAVMQQAYVKYGGYGESGVGKTYTASSLAIGLHKYIKAIKPVFFVDSETGSDFMIPRFEAAKIPLKVDKTRAFKDLLDDMDIAEKEGSILIVDSISHFWQEFIKAYKKANNRKRLSLPDWGPLKEEWGRFTDKFINCRLHILMCGRSQNIFEDVDEEGDKKSWKPIKVGTRMKGEKELSYEPSLLCEFEKVFDDREGNGSYKRKCHVLKDRSTLLDSKDFYDPTFEDFLPHVNFLNLGGDQVGVDITRTSEEMFDKNGDLARQRYAREHDIMLEEIKNILIKAALDGTSTEAKKGRVSALESAFGTAAWTAIENLKNDNLSIGIRRMKAELLGEEPPPVAKDEGKEADVPM